MTQRFSPNELFFLRNHIPIRIIITTVLKLNYHSNDGTFRFECPLCHGFDTATNPNTNLARCFACCKNFNPIDLVMAVRSLSFRSAVELLRVVRINLPSLPKNIPKNLTATPPTATSARNDLIRVDEILSRYKPHS